MEFKDLSPELRERARACKTTEELLALAKEEGIELTDEELDSFAGGVDWGCMVDDPCTSACHGNAPYVP